MFALLSQHWNSPRQRAVHRHDLEATNAVDQAEVKF